MFEPLGKIVVSRKGLGLILAWIVVSALVFSFAPSLESIQRDDNVGFFPKHYPTVIGDDLLQRGFGSDRASSQMVVAVERSGGVLSREDFAFADKLSTALGKFRDENPQWGLKPLVTYKTPIIGPRLIGTAGEAGKPEGQTVLIIQPLESTFIARKTRQALDLLIDLVEKESVAAPSGIRVGMTGSAMVGHDLNQAANSSLDATTVATIVLVLAILLIVYRSPLLALVPLLTIGFSVFLAIKALPLLTYVPGLKFQVINITSVFVVVVLFGAGTDYCLFLIARYREELIAGHERKIALSRSLEAVGAALVASAGTVIFGLGLLWFCKFAKISYIGPSIGLSLVSALLASVTIAPAHEPPGPVAVLAIRRTRPANGRRSRHDIRPQGRWHGGKGPALLGPNFGLCRGPALASAGDVHGRHAAAGDRRHGGDAQLQPARRSLRRSEVGTGHAADSRLLPHRRAEPIEHPDPPPGSRLPFRSRPHDDPPVDAPDREPSGYRRSAVVHPAFGQTVGNRRA